MSASIAPPTGHKPAPPPGTPPRAPRRRSPSTRPPWPHPLPSDLAGAAFAIGVALAIGALAAFGRGGLQLEALTWVQLALLAAGALLAALALLAAGRRSFWGAGTLIAFAIYAGLCAASTAWSVGPDESWQEANRVIAWLAVFGGGIALVRVCGRWWPQFLGGILLAAVSICVYALLTKIVPESLARDAVYARLREPLEYWNAVGLTAAFGIVAATWLGSRRDGNGVLSTLAFPAIALLTVALALSYSRGAVLALGLGLVFWFAVVPLRLRSAAVLLPSLGGGALVTWWALSQKTLTTDNISAQLRDRSGTDLAIALGVIVVVLLGVGLAVRFRMAGPPLARRTRLRAGAVLLVCVALVPVALTAKLASSERGLGGSIEHSWHSLTDPNSGATVTNGPDRLMQLASVRAKYWQEAIRLFRQAPVQGVGAGAYVVARKRVRTAQLEVLHAHGFVVQTAADLGLLGLAAITLLTLLWLRTADRVLGGCARLRELVLRRERVVRPWTDERAALASVVTIVLVFGIHSFVDWTWYVPATAAVGLLCAGWIAGRGPLTEPPAEPGLLGRRLARGVRGPWRIGAATGAIALAALAGWSAWLPLQADRDAARARSLASADASSYPRAIALAKSAVATDPLALEPRYTLAFAQLLSGDKNGARETLVAAVRTQPANPDPWLQLVDFTLNAENDPQLALALLGPALHFDPNSPQGKIDYLTATRRLQQQAADRAQAREQARAQKRERARARAQARKRSKAHAGQTTKKP